MDKAIATLDGQLKETQIQISDHDNSISMLRSRIENHKATLVELYAERDQLISAIDHLRRAR